MNITNKKILILAPHTDDAEFGCGATINKLVEQGNEVYCAAFSACKQSVLKEFPEDILITEFKAATKILGIQEKNQILFDYEVRTFNFHRQKILDDIIKLRKEIGPDIVFMPDMNDIHQDHYTIAQEGLRTFKTSTLICYELIWNNLSFNTSAFVEVSKENLQKKINALKEYKSQAHRPYSNEEFVTSLARVRGVQMGVDYAECFNVIRLKL